MRTLHQPLYQKWISFVTLIDFFCKSFVQWPLSAWRSFWFSKAGLPYRAPNTPNIAVRTDTFLGKIIDGHMVFTCTTEHQYEPEGFSIKNGDTVVDIGAHIGSFALHAATKGARVIACEPSPQNFHTLSANIARNRVQNLTALKQCVAGQSGMRTLFLDTENAARNGLYGSGQSVSVPAITLAELFAQHNVTQCDFLKMDCEGAEYEIIESTDMHTLAAIQKIAMEYHCPPHFGLDKTKHQISKLVTKLEHAGFSVMLVPENKLRGLIFTRRS